MPHRIFSLRRWRTASVSALLAGALAGAQADPAAAPAGAGNHELILRAATAKNVIDTLHWTKAESLPEGVTSIAASPTGKSLIVTGTDAGFEQVQEIVRFVDVAAKSIRIQVQFISAKTWDITSSGVPLTLLGPEPAKTTTIMAGVDARIQQASGDGVARLQAALTKSGKSLGVSTMTAQNNAEAATNMDTTHASGGAPAPPMLAGCRVAVTPRVNDDNSITLFLRPTVTAYNAGDARKVDARETKLVEKVQNGRPVMIGNLARGGNHVTDQELVIFITPTIVEDKP